MTTLLRVRGLARGPGVSGSTSAGRANRARPPAGPGRYCRIPGIAALLCLLVGLSDVLAIFRPWHERLYRISAFVPGTAADVTRSTDVIIGLMLIVLSRGLRRRKRRAWQVVIGLLAFDIAIRAAHMSRGYPPREYSAVVAVVLLAVLLYFRREFYAAGDPRTRRAALRVFASLAAADLAIGLAFLATGGLAASYPVWQRVGECHAGVIPTHEAVLARPRELVGDALA